MLRRTWITEEIIAMLDRGCEISLDENFANYYSKDGDTYTLSVRVRSINFTEMQLIESVKHYEMSEENYFIREKKKKFSLKLVSSNADTVSMGKGFKDNEERIIADRKRANDKIKRSLGIRNN